jgi:hypothetical protein
MLFCRIDKVVGNRVYAGGYCGDYQTQKAALRDWSAADLHAMRRSPGAAGAVRSVRFSDADQTVRVRAEVLDEDEIQKLAEGCYTCVALDDEGRAHLLDYQSSTDARLGKSHLLAKATLLARIHTGADEAMDDTNEMRRIWEQLLLKGQKTENPNDPALLAWMRLNRRLGPNTVQTGVGEVLKLR